MQVALKEAQSAVADGDPPDTDMLSLLAKTMRTEERFSAAVRDLEATMSEEKPVEIQKLFKATDPVFKKLEAFNLKRGDTLAANIDMEMVRLRNRLEVVAGGKDDRSTWQGEKVKSSDTIHKACFLKVLKELEKTIRKVDILARGTALKKEPPLIQL